MSCSVSRGVEREESVGVRRGREGTWELATDRRRDLNNTVWEKGGRDPHSPKHSVEIRSPVSLLSPGRQLPGPTSSSESTRDARDDSYILIFPFILCRI
jgi:hypothetical protein